jgi:hypothetical protein
MSAIQVSVIGRHDVSEWVQTAGKCLNGSFWHNADIELS